ncbi:MAG: hypothetical protein LBH47_03695 [Christensenellaceae bacterium]|jgi:hypothetical protein|nr:hypothetical protein [Christensenellaceae bacterium]
MNNKKRNFLKGFAIAGLTLSAAVAFAACDGVDLSKYKTLEEYDEYVENHTHTNEEYEEVSGRTNAEDENYSYTDSDYNALLSQSGPQYNISNLQQLKIALESAVFNDLMITNDMTIPSNETLLLPADKNITVAPGKKLTGKIGSSVADNAADENWPTLTYMDVGINGKAISRSFTIRLSSANGKSTVNWETTDEGKILGLEAHLDGSVRIIPANVTWNFDEDFDFHQSVFTGVEAEEDWGRVQIPSMGINLSLDNIDQIKVEKAPAGNGDVVNNNSVTFSAGHLHLKSAPTIPVDKTWRFVAGYKITTPENPDGKTITAELAVTGFTDGQDIIDWVNETEEEPEEETEETEEETEDPEENPGENPEDPEENPGE